jgi:hypothetical protein
VQRVHVESCLLVYSNSAYEFINKYVPSSAPDYNPPANPGFSAVPQGLTEDDMYGPLVCLVELLEYLFEISCQVELLDKLVVHVEGPRWLKFADSHLTTFTTIHKTKQDQKPDIVFLHPGDGGAGSCTPDLPMLPSEPHLSEQYQIVQV